MLSVILYGRNDDHGYNYHKRLAISLNCIAEVLSEPTDEIIFVDYNTPDELPTIVEAIQDILTLKAKSVIRVLRVRPSQHDRFRKQTTLPLLEPVARNVGVRRARPDNRWILSTNVDMIFVPENPKESLTEIVSRLKDGFYSLPRLELPENFWELSLDRLSPQQNISFLREASSQLHLNTIVRKESFLKYDNPGDFQLMLRKDILEVGGFDEQMLKGWHVDSNLCKRMFLLGKIGPSIENKLKCYHCNHTHKESFLHSQSRTQNDWKRFVSSEIVAPILTQEGWGLAEDKIEEISILQAAPSKVHLNGVFASIKEPSQKDYEFFIHHDTYNQLTYNPSRIFTYLADHLCHLPDSADIAYIGCNENMVDMLSAYLEYKQHKGKIICQKECISAHPKASSIDSFFSSGMRLPFLFIFDFGMDETSNLGKAILQSKQAYQNGRRQIKKVMKEFFKIVHRKNQIPSTTKFIGIHVSHTDFNLIFNRHLSVRLNTYITGISYGYPRKKPFKLSGSLKKKFVLASRYFIARYLFDYADPLRRLILRSKLSRIL